MELLLVEKLVNMLDKRRIRYCHWKSNEHLLKGVLGETDLDILVDGEHLKDFTDIVLGLGFKELVSNSVVKHPFTFDYLGHCSKSGTYIHIHLHTKMVTGTKYAKEFVIPISSYVLDKSVVDRETMMHISDPKVEFILLALREGLKFNTGLKLDPSNNVKKKVKFAQLEADYLKSQFSLEELLQCLAESGLYSSSLESQLINMYQNDISIKMLRQFKRISKSVVKDYRIRSIVKTSLQYVNGRGKLIIHKILKRIGYYYGYKKRIKNNSKTITVIGIDGSGKSSIVRAVSTALRWKLDVATVYLGSGVGSKSIALKAVSSISKSRQKRDIPLSSKSRRSVYRDFIKSLVFLFIARDKYRKMRSIARYNRKGILVITDRYPQVQNEGMNDGPKIQYNIRRSSIIFRALGNYEKKLYTKMVTKYPDIVVRLDVPVSVAFERKKEETIGQLNDKQSGIQSLDFPNSKVIELDSSGDIQRTMKELNRRLWKEL